MSTEQSVCFPPAINDTQKGEEDPEVHSGSQDKQPIEDDVVEADVAAHEQQAQVDEVGELAELAAVASAELESVELDNNESDKAQETVTEAEDAAALHSAEIATEEPTEGAEEPAADESGVDAAPEPAAPEPTPPPKPASVPVGPAAGKRRGISLAPKASLLCLTSFDAVRLMWPMLSHSNAWHQRTNVCPQYITSRAGCTSNQA